MQKDLQNARIQYVEKERADKSNRIELKEIQIKVIYIYVYVLGFLLLESAQHQRQSCIEGNLLRDLK